MLKFLTWLKTIVAHHLKTLTRKKMVTVLIHNRSFIIVSTTATVLVLPFIFNLINTPEMSYEGYYTLAVIKSALLFYLVMASIYKTYSIRLTGLVILLMLDTLLDVGNLQSTGFYWTMKPYRYEGSYNFYNGFIVYEVFCLFGGFVCNYIINTLPNRVENWCNNWLNRSRSNVAYCVRSFYSFA